MEKTYFSIRVMHAKTKGEAEEKLIAEDIDDGHRMSDVIVTKEELKELLKDE